MKRHQYLGKVDCRSATYVVIEFIPFISSLATAEGIVATVVCIPTKYILRTEYKVREHPV